MGREGGDPTAVGSSIALLQERFRQLQKMRERREEMELLKLFSESTEQIAHTKCYDPAKLRVQPEMIFQTRPSSLQDSLSLGLNLYSKHAESRSTKAGPPLTDFCPVDAATVSTSRTYEKPDVDTSLHL